MSETPAETAQHVTSALPPRGDDGDDIFMDGGTCPQWPLWQRLYDRTALALLGISGTLVWSGDFSVDPGGSPSSFAVNVGAIQSLVLVAEDGTVYKAYFYAGGAIGASKIEGGGSLGASTRYFVYAKPPVSGGACDFEISITPPRTNRVFKTGSGFAYQSRRYLGTFTTDGSGNPIPVRAVRGVYTYRRSALALNAFEAIGGGGGSATSWATVDLSSLIPSHARVARVELLAASAGTGGTAQLRTKGDTAGGIYFANITATSLDTDRVVYDIETDSSQRLEYQVSHASIVAQVHVSGFSE